MFTLPVFFDLAFIWAGLIGFAVLLYVILDGFDLGIGILFPFAPSDKCRDTMMNSIAPFWDGNETWLVFGGGGLLIAFPKAFALIMPALYIPIIVMLIALIFRGVAFEFRYKADMSRKFWDVSFHFGSLLATFAQGIVLGTYVQGIQIENGAFTGGMMDWLTPFALCTGIALVGGYALLGATWTVKKTTGETKIWAQRAANYMLAVVLVFMGIVSLWVPFLDTAIFTRWFSRPNVYYLSVLPLATLVASAQLYRAIKKDHDRHPFYWSIVIFILGYLGLAISLFPYIVPRSVTIWAAAASPSTLSLFLVGTAIVLPVTLFYVGYCYWIFRGKSSHEPGYAYAFEEKINDDARPV